MKYKIEYKGKLVDTVVVDHRLNLSKEDFFRARKEVLDAGDIESFAEKWGITVRAAKSMYGNEVVRQVKQKFYIIKKRSGKLLQQWRDGDSIVYIAKKERFSPVLIARFLLEELGYTKNEVSETIKNPNDIHFRANFNNERLIADIFEAHSVDYVYSTAADEKSRMMGQKGENMLEKWLKDHGIGFRNEDDLAKDEDHKETHGKTPDILLKEPLSVNGVELAWIESKSLFGTPSEMKKHKSNQLEPYVELFGKGMVVYWHGFTEGVLEGKDYFVVNRTFFEQEPEEERIPDSLPADE